MKSKNLWNNPPKPQTPEQRSIERKLLPRLKFMGYVFLFLCLSSLLFVVVMKPERNYLIGPFTEEIEPLSALEPAVPSALIGDEADDELTLEATDVLNFYVVGLLFAAIGATCLYIEKRKRKELLPQTKPLPAPEKKRGRD